MEEKSATEQIDDIITLYGGWKGDTLARLRAVVTSTDPNIVEEVKWKMRTRPEGLPVWSYKGIVCMLETFKNDQKLVFPKGAQLKDPHNLFNARQNSKTERAIQLYEGGFVDEEALRNLVIEAAELNNMKASA